MEAMTTTTAPKIHPVLQDMVESGCRNQQKIAVAFQIYLELCEVEKLWNVHYQYSKIHDFFYLTGKKSASSEEDEIFIPLSITSAISPAWLENIQNEVCRDRPVKRITLAIKEQDSTVVYYSVSQELVTPDSPETTRRKKKKQETRNLIESELHRQRLEVYESTLK